ncbi:hypothetical protein QTH97_33605 [Variovorax sp. J22R24]|uniref:hypothetical protein n=1 Tax=Variovorax gracilis TaxID=3053502 RepID=UPI002576CE57|nr:hypothetical protein [Variovorax sp. J22R24]MDM0109890.1 hypothetical protein [Variovorax sp. J22R24]
MSLALAALPCIEASAEDQPLPDCIATALNKGASLTIEGRLTVVSEAGIRVKNCREARFAAASVKVRYVAPGNSPYARSYESTEEDRGKMISERITVYSSFQHFFNWRERTRPIPAGSYAGIISSDEALGGGLFVVTPFDRSIFNAVSPSANNTGTIMLAAAHTDVSSRVLPNPCERELTALPNCSQIFSYTGERQILFAPSGPVAFAVGQDYVMRIGKKDEKLASVPPDFLKAYLLTMQVPESAGALLDRLLAKYSFSLATGNRAEALKAERQLGVSYPQLVDKPSSSVFTGATRQPAAAAASPN